MVDITWIVKNWKKIALEWLSIGYNFFVQPIKYNRAENFALHEIQQRSLKRSDINDHLPTLFVESIAQMPKLIVELGVRGGESTFVFERVGRISNAILVSVDIEDCIKSSPYEKWNFVHADDVQFAQEFPQWCKKRNIVPTIDVLFIDTSHEYQHTVDEIHQWFKHLSPNCTVFFHDTNLGPYYFRNDGSMGVAWDNKRGVIRALEEYLGTQYDESVAFSDFRRGWYIRHVPYCNGLTILQRKK